MVAVNLMVYIEAELVFGRGEGGLEKAGKTGRWEGKEMYIRIF